MVKALDILNGCQDLKAIYLLREAPDGIGGVPTEAQAGQFLLWMAVFGRKRYRSVVIDSDFFKYITGSAGDYLTRLELFAHLNRAAKPNGESRDCLSTHYWYYVHGVKEFNLEIFITRKELEALAKIIASPGQSKRHKTLTEKIRLGLGRLSRLVNESEYRAITQFSDVGQKHDSIIKSPWIALRAESKNHRCTGVNLIGYANGVLGIGEDVRAAARASAKAGVPFSILNVELPEEVTPREASNLSDFFVDNPIFPVNIFCMTFLETERMRIEHSTSLFQGRYNIGYWPWELPEISLVWHHAFDHVDEIWAISPYLAKVFSRYTDKPVTLMSPGVEVGPIEPFNLSSLGIEPGAFVFLTMLDFNSFMSRKNPIGAIDAFKRAFPDENGLERLVIKSINGDIHPQEFNVLLEHVGQDSRILVVDGTYSKAVTNGLIAAADCLISLHRAEGLGRTIAEAMLLETPVVATNWSGSKAFLDNSTGFPVGFKLMPVPSGAYIFDQGCKWAEPSITDAASKLRMVRDNPKLAQRKSSAARSRILRNYGLDAVSNRMVTRLDQITSGGSRG